MWLTRPLKNAHAHATTKEPVLSIRNALSSFLTLHMGLAMHPCDHSTCAACVPYYHIRLCSTLCAIAPDKFSAVTAAIMTNSFSADSKLAAMSDVARGSQILRGIGRNPVLRAPVRLAAPFADYNAERSRSSQPRVRSRRLTACVGSTRPPAGSL